MAYLDPNQMAVAPQTGITPYAPAATGIGASYTNAGATSATAVPNVDTSVSDRVTALASTDSAMNRAAQGIGLRTANRRGLVNSSIAAGAATGAVLDRVTPIASQEAQQQYGAGINSANLAAAERERLAASVTTAAGNLQQAQSATLNNENIPAATRAALQSSNTAVFNAQIAALQKLYGTNLSWNA